MLSVKALKAQIGLSCPQLPWSSWPGIPVHTLCPWALELHLSSVQAPALPLSVSVSIPVPGWSWIVTGISQINLGSFLSLLLTGTHYCHLWLCSTCSDNSGLSSAEKALSCWCCPWLTACGVALFLLLRDSEVSEFYRYKGQDLK